MNKTVKLRVVDADNIDAFYRFVNVRLMGNKLPLHDASGNRGLLLLMIVAKQIC